MRTPASIRRFLRTALPVLGCATLPGCGGKSTFVDLQIRGATSTPMPGIKRLVVTLDLGGKAAETELSEKDGRDIQLPTSASFEVRSGAGALNVSVSAQDAAGIERDHGTASGNVAAGDTTQVDVQMQGAARQATLTVRRIGVGVGRIVSTPAGIDCGAVCSAPFDVNTPVTLTATTDFTSSVSGWSSPSCAGSTCPVVASSDQTVTVSFNCDFRWVVDAGGTDANAGGCAAPFKTITKALGLAAAGDSVAVRPGLYDAPGNGESFPLAVPAGVALVGDEPGKGNGAAATTIFGGGAVSSPSVTTALHPAASATVAGFTITCAGGTSCAGILPQGNAVTIRNNTITGNATYGIEVANSTTNHVIVGNVIENSGTAGIGYVQTSAGGKAERNLIRKNQRGVEYDTAGGDLGGGPSGSAGGNVLSCNTQNDVWTSQTIALSLRDNQWDHAPPAQSCSAGGDLCSTSLLPATFDAAGATVAASPCP